MIFVNQNIENITSEYHTQFKSLLNAALVIYIPNISPAFHSDSYAIKLVIRIKCRLDLKTIDSVPTQLTKFYL